MKLMQRKTLFVVALLVMVLCSYFIWIGFFSKPQQAIPEIRLGDGINGPKGMAVSYTHLTLPTTSRV